MLYGDNTKGYGDRESGSKIPKNKLGKKPLDPRLAAGLIRNQLLDEGNARLNLATFCQTYMDEDAIKLMSETLEKNAIDKSEYPQTAELERRCVNIIADLWNAPKAEDYVGTSTVGSSEACMLAGMAMKFRWRQAEIAKGRDIVGRKPNLVISTAYQVCWEKFGVYFDVDLRTVPLDEEHLSLNTDVVLDYVDENTIGIVGILGGTYTGHYDDIKALDELVSEYNYTHEHQLVIHIDGASGGMFVPFVQPELLWDFRLKNVVSISTSGHKYGLVYPGVGWIVWRDKEYLPKELVFEVEYLGGSMPTMAINFSRSASQIIGQYYNFLRFGFEGYEAIHKKTQDVGLFISKAIEETGLFTFYNKGEGLPIICYKLKADKEIKWNLYDLADRLRMRGWQVPAYPLSANLEEVIIQRIVCRADFTYNLAEEFVKDFKEAITELKSAHILFHEEKRTAYGFTH